jgi:hypothetical protein
MMAIGVLLDDRSIYAEAITYFKSGIGTGNIDNTVYFEHPGKLGQWQESGRDQGHATLGVPLIATIAQMAWNQGDDLVQLRRQPHPQRRRVHRQVQPRLRRAVRNVRQQRQCRAAVDRLGKGRGGLRTGFETIYNHYVQRDRSVGPVHRRRGRGRAARRRRGRLRP